MKTFTRFALCFVLLTISRAHAQETFAPLITENCVAFVHVDCSKIEINAVKENLQKLGEDFLKGLAFDDNSQKATLRELAVELEKLDMLVRPTFETLTKELGIREFAIIADMELMQQNVPSIAVIPWKNKTEKHFETFIQALATIGQWDASSVPSMDSSNFVQSGDFLLLVPGQHEQKANVANWAKNGKPAAADLPIREALKSVAGAEIKVAVALPEQLRTMMLNGAELPPDMPLEVRNLLLFSMQKIEWASASLSMADILGKEPAKNADVFLTVKTMKPADAAMLRGMLETFIDWGVNFAQFNMQQEMMDEEFQLPPLVFQFAKGFLRTLLPEVNEDKLLFRIKGDFGGVMRGHAAISTAGMGVALLLPAVQASREAARRMQCANQVKWITLAMHNYHDAKQTFPPLYTVDANGKPLHSWRVHILPYIEQTAMYQQIRLDEPWDSEHNKQFHDRMPNNYACPTNPGQGCTYVGIAGEGFRPAKEAGQRGKGIGLGNITDGTSNTFMIIEVKEGFCWMDPTADITLDELVKGINGQGRAGSFHPGGCNIGMFDGSVRFISETIDKEILRAFGTINGGESVNYRDL